VAAANTIGFHRTNIHVKLGLSGRPMNLVSYLRVMSDR
jgi:hypothetical protein